MATIHFMLQGKGGVGKSFICYLLYQYLQQRGLTVKGYDTDPNNASFSRYSDMDVTVIKILDDAGMDIDMRRFDHLMNELCNLPDNCQVVIDNGASSYISFCSYIFENGTLPFLIEMGHSILLHSVITGGAAMYDTCTNLQTLFTNFPGFSVVTWLNPKDGEIISKGKDFSGFKVFEENKPKFHAVIEIPQLKAALSGKDLTELLIRLQTFRQAFEDKSLSIPVKQRLIKLWRDLVSTIDKASLC